MAILWETVDRLGRPVVLTDEGWQHILAEHEELREHQDAIRQAVALAAEVRRDATYRRRAIHYRPSGRGRLQLRVVVQYRPIEPSGWAGEVITAYLTAREYANEERLWP